MQTACKGPPQDRDGITRAPLHPAFASQQVESDKPTSLLIEFDSLLVVDINNKGKFLLFLKPKDKLCVHEIMF